MIGGCAVKYQSTSARIDTCDRLMSRLLSWIDVLAPVRNAGAATSAAAAAAAGAPRRAAARGAGAGAPAAPGSRRLLSSPR